MYVLFPLCFWFELADSLDPIWQSLQLFSSRKGRLWSSGG